MGRMTAQLSLLGALLILTLAEIHGETPPSSVIAVANRDAEGAIVLDADVTRNYVPSASACRNQCINTTGCNVWIWCGAVSGCTTGSYSRDASRFQQCWLKYDNPPTGSGGTGRFPRAKNSPDSSTGWMSGTTVANFTDGVQLPEKSYSCNCKSNYTYGSYRFLGVCARLGDYGASCVVDPNCSQVPDDETQGCPGTEPCTVLLDTDLKEDKVLVSGDASNTADSAEDCCGQCASTKNCNLWTWCSDASGCNGERYRFRQCWLKAGDPLNPQPKAGYGGSPGWISGVLPAWIPA